jgi:hypothetical protein
VTGRVQKFRLAERAFAALGTGVRQQQAAP